MVVRTGTALGLPHSTKPAEAQGIFSPLRGCALKQTEVQLRECDRSLCTEKSERVRRF